MITEMLKYCYNHILCLSLSATPVKTNFHMAEKIMIVDDEMDICEILQFNLENAGYETVIASSSEEALEIIDSQVSLILLDVMLSGRSGFKMADILRKERKNDVPIIFLTARNAENDLLTGFSAGGDDYICKPFSIHEVIARVKAVLRRRPQSAVPSDLIVEGHIKIDSNTKIVYIKDIPVTLSKKEFEVLKLLASNPGKVFSREEIIDALWKDAPYVVDRTIDVHIERIRSKIGDCKNYITNRSGYGYCFKVAE